MGRGEESVDCLNSMASASTGHAGAAGGRISAGVGANLIGMHASERNPDATVYVGNLDVQASEETVAELFVQAGPLGEFDGVSGVLS